MGWRTRAMRWVGVALLAASLGVGIVAYGIDTSVTTGAVWTDGVFQGVTETRDADAVRQRRDGLVVAGVLALTGGVLVVMGGRRDKGRVHSE